MPRTPHDTEAALQSLWIVYCDQDLYHLHDQSIAERWPTVRSVMQDAGSEYEQRFEKLRLRFVNRASFVDVAAVDSLPSAEQAPDLQQFIAEIASYSQSNLGAVFAIAALFCKYDRLMTAVGL